MNIFETKNNSNIIQGKDYLTENPEIKETKDIFINNIDDVLKNNIQEKNIFGTNLDLFKEKLLANIFWLNDKKIKKLSLDYEENLTLSQTLNHAENFWEYRKINV